MDCDREQFTLEQHSARSDLAGEIRKLLTQSEAISAQQIAIADRKIELLNGAGRLKSAFDRNYNIQALDAKSRALAEQQDLVRQRMDLLRMKAKIVELDDEAFALNCGAVE